MAPWLLRRFGWTEVLRKRRILKADDDDDDDEVPAALRGGGGARETGLAPVQTQGWNGSRTRRTAGLNVWTCSDLPDRPDAQVSSLDVQMIKKLF